MSVPLVASGFAFGSAGVSSCMGVSIVSSISVFTGTGSLTGLAVGVKGTASGMLMSMTVAVGSSSVAVASFFLRKRAAVRRQKFTMLLSTG